METLTEGVPSSALEPFRANHGHPEVDKQERGHAGRDVREQHGRASDFFAGFDEPQKQQHRDDAQCKHGRKPNF